MKAIAILILTLFCLQACDNDSASTSPFNEILSKPPYNSITDSISDEPRRADLYFRRGILLNKNNQPNAALVDFEKAWELDKSEIHAVSAANAYLDSKPDSAVSFLQKVLKDLPESIYLKLLLARAYDRNNETDKALLVANDLLTIDSGFVNIIMLKAELLEKKGDMAGTLLALEQAHRILPDNREIGDKLAYQYAEKKDPRALKLADRLIATDTLDLDAGPYFVKGLYYSNIGQYALAMQAFDTTIRHDYNYLNAYLEKGKIQFNKKDIAAALSTFRLANRIKPAYADAWYWIGRCEESMGDKKAARLSYMKAYELDKTFTEAKSAMESIPE